MGRKIKRVLVTAIGTMNCTTIISELKNHSTDYYILGADINDRCCIANSNEVNEYFKFPSVLKNREEYAEFVLTFCKDHKVDFVFCVVDEEVEILARKRDMFEKEGIVLCIANTEAIITCHNKSLFADWSEREIPEYCIKRYLKYDDIKKRNLPIFIKPIEGRASIGCKKIERMSDLLEYKKKWNNYVAEEFVTGDIVAVDIVRNTKYNQFEIAQRLELLRNSNGCGVAVEIIDNPSIKNACIKIAEKLNINGVVNVEFFITPDGPKVIEINPRLPAGIAFSCLAGLDIVINALRIAEGRKCEFGKIKIGSHYAKRYETYETTCK